MLLLAFLLAPRLAGAAPEPVSIRSQSGQFVVQGLPLGAPLSGYSTSAVRYLRLDPTLTAISLDRIRQVLGEDTLGVKDKWHGLITVATHPVQEDDPSVRITSTRYADGWGYRIDFPERIDKERFVNVAMRVILLEIANRGAIAREAELPPWLAEGLSAELQATSLSTLALEPALPVDRSAHTADPLRSVREVLRRRPALTFDELNMPSAEQVSGANAEWYRACAHLFVHELLRLHGGRDALRDMLYRLKENLNWQTAFLRSFASHFPRLIDADKWYALNVAHVAGRDPMSLWPLETIWQQLDAILATKVQVRLGANELPIDTSVSLQRIITEWDFARQQPVLLQKVEQLLALRPRVPAELAGLVEGYVHVLQSYAGERAPRTARSPDRQTGTRHLAAGVRSALQQLDELDTKREKLRERETMAIETRPK